MRVLEGEHGLWRGVRSSLCFGCMLTASRRQSHKRLLLAFLMDRFVHMLVLYDYKAGRSQWC